MTIASEYKKRLNPFVLSQSSIPMVVLSSGTMGDNGALSGITALAATLPKCYVYLPADAISSGSAAGWYYAEMSSTTAGTVYNNTYTSGTPAFPASKTAFSTTGPGAFTGVAAEKGVTITIPGGAIGPSGRVEVEALWSFTNGANNKTSRVRYSGSSGTTYLAITRTTVAGQWGSTWFINQGSESRQVGPPSTLNGVPGPSGGNPTITLADSSGDTEVFISAHPANAADNHTLEAFTVKVTYGP